MLHPNRWLVRQLLESFFSVRIYGVQNLPQRGPFVLAAHHESLLDGLVLGAMLPRPVHFLSDAELRRIPLVGGFLRYSGTIAVQKASADLGAMRRALALLREGRGVGIFPAGRISPSGAIEDFTEGAVWLAWKSGAPLVPVWLRSRDAWPLGERPRPGAGIRVVVGEPYRVETGAQGGKRALAGETERLRERIRSLKWERV